MCEITVSYIELVLFLESTKIRGEKSPWDDISGFMFWTIYILLMLRWPFCLYRSLIPAPTYTLCFSMSSLCLSSFGGLFTFFDLTLSLPPSAFIMSVCLLIYVSTPNSNLLFSHTQTAMLLTSQTCKHADLIFSIHPPSPAKMRTAILVHQCKSLILTKCQQH